MALRINTNVAAINAHRQLLGTEQKMGASMEKLSSGYRINRASDDAAGLSVANRLRTNVRSLTVASRNVTEARAMVGIAEGAGSQIESILERMKELATQAASDNAANDRSKIDSEFTSLRDEITRIVNDTEYQGTTLLNGGFGAVMNTTTSTADTATGVGAIDTGGAVAGTYTITQTAGGAITIAGSNGVTQTVTTTTDGAQSINFDALGLTFTTAADFDADAQDLDATKIVIDAGTGGTYQVGSSNDTNADEIKVSLGDLRTTALGIDASTLATRTDASAALSTIDDAIDAVGVVLGNIGAAVNRMDYTYSNLQVTIENFSASESVIRDVDMASEMVNFTKSQILLQAGTAMLAQANMSSQGVLSLMR